MGAAEKTEKVELDAGDFRRLINLFERLVVAEERKLAGRSSAARRAKRQEGSTTDEAEAHVVRRLRKVRSK